MFFRKMSFDFHVFKSLTFSSAWKLIQICFSNCFKTFSNNFQQVFNRKTLYSAGFQNSFPFQNNFRKVFKRCQKSDLTAFKTFSGNVSNIVQQFSNIFWQERFAQYNKESTKRNTWGYNWKLDALKVFTFPNGSI